MKFSKILLSCFLLIISFSAQAQIADKILFNATIYTVNPKQPYAEALGIKGNKIIFVGSNSEVKKYSDSKTEKIDCKGQFMMPGLIEGHGHIHGMGASLIDLNLMKAKNWGEIIAMVSAAAKKAKPGDWIIGRGWHQEKWDQVPAKNHLGYPYHDEIDKVTPKNPIMLTHASGHSAYINAKAMELAGIKDNTPSPEGGAVVKDKNGIFVGVLEERAQGLVYQAYNNWKNKRTLEEQKSLWAESIRLAENECLRYGITSFQDAGSSFEQVAWMKELAENNKLQIRHWLMVREGIQSLEKNSKVFPIENSGNGHLTVKAIKVSLDGALGSYGAWMLEPYTDRNDFYGQNTFSVDELKKIASFSWKNNLQLCVHAIGDRANREVIDIYTNEIQKNKPKDHRWRVEHAQNVNPADIPRFAKSNIIASMQGIHCTSDAPYVVKRLGEQRASAEAYMWRDFIKAGVLVNNGTDVPVENIDPFANFYSSVTRKLADGSSFYEGQKMTREEAIYSYTLANAIASFSEKEKGSIEVGKWADIIILDKNILLCQEDEILKINVKKVFVGGKSVKNG
jgi:predicted amidohydrolase YtcJ